MKQLLLVSSMILSLTKSYADGTNDLLITCLSDPNVSPKCDEIISPHSKETLLKIQACSKNIGLPYCSEMGLKDEERDAVFDVNKVAKMHSESIELVISCFAGKEKPKLDFLNAECKDVMPEKAIRKIDRTERKK